MKKIPSFLSFRFQYKCQNRKLGNLGNFQLPKINEIQSNLEVLEKFPSFSSFRFRYKNQNRKLGNLGNFQLYFIKWNRLLLRHINLQTLFYKTTVYENHQVIKSTVYKNHQNKSCWDSFIPNAFSQNNMFNLKKKVFTLYKKEMLHVLFFLFYIRCK